jgi:V/A-type H+-transporting ATPase subunit A
MSGRLEEMPGEEDTLVSRSRIAQFYNGRAVSSVNAPSRERAALPRSEPYHSGGTLRNRYPSHNAHRQGVLGPGFKPRQRAPFPGDKLAQQLFLNLDNLKPWYDANFGKSFMENRKKAMAVLQEESELQEIVKLVGIDSLSPADRLTLETAKMIREDFLQQNAFVDTDNYSEYERQARLLSIILQYGELSKAALSAGASLQDLSVLKQRIK